jgi:hypothetical protein
VRVIPIVLTAALAARASAETCTPPRITFVVDRSTTMLEPVAGGASTYWDVLRAGVIQVAIERQGHAELGLGVFPETAWSCAAGGKLVVSPLRGAAIALAAGLEAHPPGPQHYTPIAATLAELADDPATRGAVVLVTDGRESCPDAEPRPSRQEAVAHAARLAERGVRFYVVAVPTPHLDADLADALARAGGTEAGVSLDGEDLAGALRDVFELEGAGDPGCVCRAGEERACGYPDVGACRAGEQRCGDGGWGACEGTVGPAAEVGGGLDNDCDGEADESADAVCPLGHSCVAGRCSGVPAPPLVHEATPGCGVGRGASPWAALALVTVLAGSRARRRGTRRGSPAARRRPCRAG